MPFKAIQLDKAIELLKVGRQQSRLGPGKKSGRWGAPASEGNAGQGQHRGRRKLSAGSWEPKEEAADWWEV